MLKLIANRKVGRPGSYELSRRILLATEDRSQPKSDSHPIIWIITTGGVVAAWSATASASLPHNIHNRSVQFPPPYFDPFRLAHPVFAQGYDDLHLPHGEIERQDLGNTIETEKHKYGLRFPPNINSKPSPHRSNRTAIHHQVILSIFALSILA